MYYFVLSGQNETMWSCKNTTVSHGSPGHKGRDRQVQVALAEKLLAQMTLNWDPSAQVIQENVYYYIEM